MLVQSPMFIEVTEIIDTNVEVKRMLNTNHILSFSTHGDATLVSMKVGNDTTQIRVKETLVDLSLGDVKDFLDFDSEAAEDENRTAGYVPTTEQPQPNNHKRRTTSMSRARTRVKPLGGFLVVKPKQIESKSKGGIVIATAAQGVQFEYGEVSRLPTDDVGNLSLPEGYESLKLGDIVMYPAHKGLASIPDGEETVRILEIDKILAIIEGER